MRMAAMEGAIIMSNEVSPLEKRRPAPRPTLTSRYASLSNLCPGVKPTGELRMVTWKIQWSRRMSAWADTSAAAIVAGTEVRPPTSKPSQSPSGTATRGRATLGGGGCGGERTEGAAAGAGEPELALAVGEGAGIEAGA